MLLTVILIPLHTLSFIIHISLINLSLKTTSVQMTSKKDQFKN